MAKNPSMTVPFVNQGGKESVIGMAGRSLPMVLLGDRIGTATSKVVVTAPRLYARQTAVPHKGRPFMENADITSPTNSINATIDIPDADAVKFRNSDVCTFYDVSASDLSTETLTLNASTGVGAAGSGGAGLTLLTFVGVWTAAPAANDLLAVADGTELSANAVMVLEEIEYDGSTEFQTPAFIDGAYNKAEVENTERFDSTKNSAIELMEVA